MLTPRPSKCHMGGPSAVLVPPVPSVPPAPQPKRSSGGAIATPPALRSYAQAAASQTVPQAVPSKLMSLVHLTRAFPQLSADKVASLFQRGHGTIPRGSKRASNTTGGPTRRSLIICIQSSSVDLVALAQATSSHLKSILGFFFFLNQLFISRYVQNTCAA